MTLTLSEAQVLANRIVSELRGSCERIAIAGSVRRGKLSPGDIEIVCIPKTEMCGLFGDEPEVDSEFCMIVNRWEKIRGEPTGKYTQRIVYGMNPGEPSAAKLDLFIARPENWGLILAIRTGSADFAHKRLACRWKQLGYKSVDGMLHDRDGRPVPVWEERDLFELLGMPWIPPDERAERIDGVKADVVWTDELVPEEMMAPAGV